MYCWRPPELQRQALVDEDKDAPIDTGQRLEAHASDINRTLIMQLNTSELQNSDSKQIRWNSTLTEAVRFSLTKTKIKQDHQALLKAKYCPWVAAVPRTQENIKNPCDLDLWPMTLKFNRVLEVVEVRYMCMQNFIKVSAAIHELLTVNKILDNSRLWSWISLEWIKQSTSGKVRLFPCPARTI